MPNRASLDDAAVLDWLAAAGLLGLALLEALFGPVTSPRWQQALISVAWTLPLGWRRRFPIGVLVVVMGAGAAMGYVNTEGGLISFVLADVLASFTVGRYVRGKATWWGPALVVGLWWAYYAASEGTLTDYEFTALIYGGAWGVGYVLRRRDTSMQRLSADARRLKTELSERERRAAEQERARIARELHDIISHSISAVVIHSQAVRLRLDGSVAQRDIDELRAIETSARDAMVETRRLFGMLRADGEAPALSPQPGLDQLDALLAETQAAGVRVTLHVEGEPVELAPGVDLAVYRIVQESLTNVMKHATGASATVRLSYGAEQLSVYVKNSASPTAPLAAGGPGHGLIGMRERVSLYGGTLRAQPRSTGGFVVEASLPYDQAGKR